MGGYTATTFNSGNPPGIDAAFLNAFQTWIQQTEGDVGSVVANGQTSGTATMYQILQGVVKKFVVILSNYKNTANQYLTLPTAFTSKGWFNIGNTGGGHISFLSGGSGGTAANCDLIISFSAAGGTIASPQSFTANYSIGMIESAFDTVQLQVNSSAANGLLIVEGV